MIRKVLFILLLSALGLENLKAQENEFKREWNIGASFGANLSQAGFGTSTNASPFKTSLWQQYQGGVSVRYLTERNLGLIVEMNYSQQGWKQNFVDKNEVNVELQELQKQLEHSHQLNYFEIPFLTHIYFGNKVRFFINLGPKIGLLLSEKETFNDKLLDYLASGDIPGKMVTEQYFMKADRKFDYGIMAGLGMEFQTGIGNFALEGRYTFGLADFYSNSKADHFQQSANRVIGIKATYYVKLF